MHHLIFRILKYNKYKFKNKFYTFYKKKDMNCTCVAIANSIVNKLHICAGIYAVGERLYE